MSTSRQGIPSRTYRWILRERAPLDHLKSFADVHPLAVQLLWNRGVRDTDDVHAFAQGSAVSLPSPWLMRGVAEAVRRLDAARAGGESVVVYGDYDVDGITSTVVLAECLRLLGIPTTTFVPRRHVEGYGLNDAALEKIREQGAKLVVAVDCGISGNREIQRAREIGLDVIVADHHHVPPKLPEAVAVVNPRQDGCPYPFKDLCAAGIVYRLAQALLEHAGLAPDVADQWLDLVAVATVADVVPLLGENRALVLRGLPALNPPRRVGLRALASRAGLTDGRIDARSIAFAIAPRLNAAGRLGDARASLELLLATSSVEAATLADELDAANRERQRLTDEALIQARDEILAWAELPKLLMVVRESYPSGVVGLVAAKLVEEFCRPALVAELGTDVARGSARSIDGFHIARALERCADVLSRHGGHARAAGFTVPASNLDCLRQRLEEIACGEITDDDVLPRLDVDTEIRLTRLDKSLLDVVQQLEPLGFGNPQPLFLTRQLRVIDARVVGRTAPGHLRLKLHDSRRTWDAIAFGMGDRKDDLSECVDVVYSVERDDWNGRNGTRLRLRDLRPSTS